MRWIVLCSQIFAIPYGFRDIKDQSFWRKFQSSKTQVNGIIYSFYYYNPILHIMRHVWTDFHENRNFNNFHQTSKGYVHGVWEVKKSKFQVRPKKLLYMVFWCAESFCAISFSIFQLVFEIWKFKVFAESFESSKRPVNGIISSFYYYKPISHIIGRVWTDFRENRNFKHFHQTS